MNNNVENEKYVPKTVQCDKDSQPIDENKNVDRDIEKEFARDKLELELLKALMAGVQGYGADIPAIEKTLEYFRIIGGINETEC